MAASQVKSVGGYHCEFIDPVSDDFICKVCNCVAREPNLTVCCGQHYCQSCIMKIVEDGKPCPNPECGEATFNAVLNRNCKRKILALCVHCTMKQRGCQWMGKVEQLDTHLDVNSGDCQYVDVECPEKCGQQVQRHQLATHITDKCPKRDFTCMHCDFKATYEVVSEQHWPECQNYPVPCPNRCQIGAVERNTLEDHLNMCSLQVVECDFSYAGCSEELQRQDMEKHVEENTQKHLALMAAASVRMSREFEKKLQEQIESMQKSLKKEQKEEKQWLQQQIEHIQKKLQGQEQEQREQRDEFRGYLEQKERETAEQLKQKDEQIIHIEESLQEQLQEKDKKVQGELHEKQQQIEALKEQIVQVQQDHEERSQQQVERIGKLEKQLKEKEQELEQLNMKVQVGVPPFTFTMSNFNQLKTKDTYWDSPPIYTHTHGYKFYIVVGPNGWCEGYGTHVSVHLYSMSGEFDATLQWPAKFTITLQLLNQHRDQDHITAHPCTHTPMATHSTLRYGNVGQVQQSSTQRLMPWPPFSGWRSSPSPYSSSISTETKTASVTKQFQWNKPEREREYVGYFTNRLIAHTDLELNVQRQTQYLKDDCLRFRITKIEANK